MNNYPTPINELFDRIVSEMVDALFESQPQYLHEFLDTPEEERPMYHMTTGRYIRNHYNLWTNEDLRKAGIHPDDFSGECLDEIHARGLDRRRRMVLSK